MVRAVELKTVETNQKALEVFRKELKDRPRARSQVTKDE